MAAAPRWTRLEHDERREQILAAARRLFSDRPPGSVSTTDSARVAGAARGLLHHYSWTKRELYLEVMRSVLRHPPLPVPEAGDGDGLAVLADAIDRWLTNVERNRETWIAAHGAQGLGRDPEVEALLEDSREQAIDRLVGVLAPERPGPAPRPLLRAYAAFAETASLEWLVRRRLTREQVHELLLSSLLTLVRSVLPGVEDLDPHHRSPTS